MWGFSRLGWFVWLGGFGGGFSRLGWFAWLGGLGMLVMLRVVWGGGPAELVCLAGRVRRR